MKLVGSRPLVMHNGRLADPLDEFTKAVQQISRKRYKTDADHEQMAKLEFLGSLWLGGEPLRPVLPDSAILATLIDGAKKTRSGPAAKAGLDCLDHAVLEYDGPTDPHTLWEDKRFRLRSGVKVQRSRVIRTRPIFRTWRTLVRLEYEDSLLNTEQVVEFTRRAGFEVGIGDWRPRYGRFLVDVE